MPLADLSAKRTALVMTNNPSSQTEGLLAVEQRHSQWAEELVGAANIVSHDGYYEADIDRVAATLARLERDDTPSVKAMRNNAILLASICQKARHSSTAVREIARVHLATPGPKATGEVEVDYEVWQADAFGDGDATVAGSTSLADALEAALHPQQTGEAKDILPTEPSAS